MFFVESCVNLQHRVGGTTAAGQTRRNEAFLLKQNHVTSLFKMELLYSPVRAPHPLCFGKDFFKDAPAKRSLLRRIFVIAPHEQ